MKYLYEDELIKLEVTCPPLEYKPENINNVFRWVFNSIDDDRNFKPRFYLVPKPILENKSDAENVICLRCQCLSENAAKERFNFLKDNQGKVAYKRFGTKIAKGHIEEKDGVNEKPNNYVIVNK